jgi:hypothetical protein
VSGTLGLTTLDQAAATLGMTPPDVAALAERGELDALALVGGGWITTPAAVAAVVRRRQRGTKTSVRSSTRPGRRTRPQDGATPRRGTPPSIRAPRPAEIAVTPAEPVPVPSSRVPVDLRPDVEPNQRLTLHAAAAALGIDYRDALRLARHGTLRATQLGREWVTTTREVGAYVKRYRRTDPHHAA